MLQFVLGLLARARVRMTTSTPTTPLGRWCHPSSDRYKKTCNQDIKAMLNIDDHGFLDTPRNQTDKRAKQIQDA